MDHNKVKPQINKQNKKFNKSTKTQMMAKEKKNKIMDLDLVKHLKEPVLKEFKKNQLILQKMKIYLNNRYKENNLLKEEMKIKHLKIWINRN